MPFTASCKTTVLGVEAFDTSDSFVVLPPTQATNLELAPQTLLNKAFGCLRMLGLWRNGLFELDFSGAAWTIAKTSHTSKAQFDLPGSELSPVQLCHVLAEESVGQQVSTLVDRTKYPIPLLCVQSALYVASQTFLADRMVARQFLQVH